MNSKIETLMELIAENQIEKVLEQLVSIFSMTDSELFVDAHLLLSDYNRWESDIRRNREAVEELELTKNKIYSSTISLIDELKSDASILETYHQKEEKLNTTSVERSNLPIAKTEQDILFKRMSRIKNRNIDFKILWIDDEPHFQINERTQLEEIGVEFDIAVNEDEARGLLRNIDYQLIISDIARTGRDKNGLAFLQELIGIRKPIPFIFYISDLDASRGTPPYAFGITNSLYELFHLVMDLIERRG